MFTFSWPHAFRDSAWKDYWRTRMYSDVVQAAGQYLNDRQVRAFFEIGKISPETDSGYAHCHLIIGWHQPVKFDSFHRIILGWQSEVISLQRSNACHVIPRGDREASRVGAYALMLQYCSDPHKTKAVDSEGLSWIAPPPIVRPPRPHEYDFFWELTHVLLPRLQPGVVTKGFLTPTPRPKPDVRLPQQRQGSEA